MNTISIAMLPVRDQAALFSICPNQDAPQACFIALNLSTGRMSAQTNPEIGNAVPLDVWHGIERRYGLPGPILASVANTLMEDIASHAQDVLDRAEVVWDGTTHVVRAHERNCDRDQDCACPIAVAERMIEAATDSISDEDMVVWGEAGDWYTDGVDEYVARVQAGESIDDVSAHMEEEIEVENRGGHNDYWYVVEGIPEYLARKVAIAKAEEVGA